MQRGAMGLQHEVATGGAVQLPPGTATGMAIGTDIPAPHQAIIATVRIGAEVVRGVHLARAAARGYDAGWRATGRLGSVLVGLLTGGTRGLAGEARKRLQLTGALGRCLGRPGR